MPSIVIRTEAHALCASPTVREDVQRTVDAYRRAVRAIATVAMTHWPALGALPAKGKGAGLGRCQALEALFHATALRPVVRYPMLDRLLGKMPSYLRRAAIEAAVGAVSSFLANYSLWLDGEIGGKPRAAGSRAPRLGLSNVFPPLYGGNMLLVGVKTSRAEPPKASTPHGHVRVKLLGAGGAWAFSAPLRLRGKPKRMLATGEMELSPTLMQRGAKVWLSCPVQVRPPRLVAPKATGRVCSIDVGINTAATAAIVDSTGTVIARTFLTCGRHNDQRDALGGTIAARQTQSGGTRRGEAFCSALHRRIAGLSLYAARRLASEITAFAVLHGASAFVIEDLKGWRPKGPSRTQKKRFHRFQHRMLVRHLTLKAEELGLRVLAVYARGTSRYAYDGSGKVVRSRENAQLATFATGKQYNADLNGALNIAARGLAMLLGIAPRQEIKAGTGKSSGPVTRMPLVLADVWAHAKSVRPSLRGPSNRPASPAGVLA
ncbi:MAG: transposase [Burkholderiales bacterium]|nr:transposase [Burkholderiales bacterium]